jgi:hypothetical protein
MTARRTRKKTEETASSVASPGAKLVYTHAPILLAKLVEKTDTGWKVDLGTVVREIAVDASVDPSLLHEAYEHGARAIVDASGTPAIVGVVATRRALSIDREGRVDAKVKALEVTAEEQILFKVPGAFVRAKAREVEVFGERVITRARNVAKILAAMIKLN